MKPKQPVIPSVGSAAYDMSSSSPGSPDFKMSQEVIADTILQVVETEPSLALPLLTKVECPDRRGRLARLIASSWPREKITIAWNAVAKSELSFADKQLMFNELWG